LKKKLEEVRKVVEKVEKVGYDIGVVETEESLRAEVSGSIDPIASRCGMRPSTRLGLRHLLP